MSLFCHFLWVQKTFDLQILVLLKSGKRMVVQRVNRKKSKNTENAANRPDPTGTEIKRVEHRRDTRRLTHNQRHTHKTPTNTQNKILNHKHWQIAGSVSLGGETLRFQSRVCESSMPRLIPNRSRRNVKCLSGDFHCQSQDSRGGTACSQCGSSSLRLREGQTR